MSGLGLGRVKHPSKAPGTEGFKWSRHVRKKFEMRFLAWSRFMSSLRLTRTKFPTGLRMSVAGTAFDSKAPRAIDERINSSMAVSAVRLAQLDLGCNAA
jgi:hypothetical protein